MLSVARSTPAASSRASVPPSISGAPGLAAGIQPKIASTLPSASIASAASADPAFTKKVSAPLIGLPPGWNTASGS